MIHNNQWSEHDIGGGVIPEPSTALIFLIWGAIGIAVNHPRWLFTG